MISKETRGLRKIDVNEYLSRQMPRDTSKDIEIHIYIKVNNNSLEVIKDE